ncbi:MAG: formylglycine-generating enzyme family protein [Planctomycetes bacterium]|nr:formylglycine-generating enzyme family protein [Planctomycetota bacterium]
MRKEKPKKVLTAICIVTLITVVSIVVFLKYHQSTDQPTGTDKTPVGAAQEVAAEESGNVVTNSIGMKLVYIPAGSFMMGNPSNEKDHYIDEGPQHQVHISEGFWMGQTEVTQGQYKSVMNAEPWSGNKCVQEDANNPAVFMRWDKAAEFCRKLSQQEGKTYRLPTEAEWEYACRAGTTTRFSFGDSDSSLGDYAWFNDNTSTVDQKYAHSVGQKKPNPWGLSDMHGNVCEWCSDFCGVDYYSYSPIVDPKGPSSGDARSLRGGSWGHFKNDLRCSERSRGYPGISSSNFGFRVVRSQP